MQAAKHGGTQVSVSRIVIHATVSPCVEGGARAVAGYFQLASAGGSAHYTVDPGEVVASVREDTVAYHAPPNTGSIGIELCDPQKGSASRWADRSHQEMLRRAAVLVRQVAARWDVPLRRLSVAEVRAGKRGICGHVDVSRAFGQTDHSDPGTGFPWEAFMAMVTGDEEKAVKVVVRDGIALWPGRTLEVRDPMMRGEDVRAWQERLARRGWELDVDGVYGNESRSVCRSWQRAVGLPATGRVDEATWESAWSWTPPVEEPASS
ncbi:peptidoglycan recognition protein family protein [Micrococcus luteus]|uniref:peptidoglycan recognition protein family protein n=1 Tax=Micrococcus luteus TaxID=1270 RepID=UPI00331E4777